MERLLSVSEVAQKWGVSCRTVYLWCQRGELSHKKLGQRLVRLSQKDVEAFEEEARLRAEGHTA